MGKEELRAAAAALEGSVVVAGVGAGPGADAGVAARDADPVRAAAGELLPADGTASPRIREAEAVVVGVGGRDEGANDAGRSDDAGGESAGGSGATVEEAARLLRAARERDALAVAVTAAGDPDRIDALRAVADAAVLAGEGGVAGAVAAFVALVRDPGFVNLDLADARTALRAGDLAALGRGTAGLDAGGAERAVAAAFDGMAPGVVPGGAAGVLVDVVGDPAMSVADASAAVTAARRRVGRDAHVIWGGAVDDALAGEVRARVVAAGVGLSPVPSAGGPCPRCGARLAAYSLDGRATPACDDCGYAGVAASLQDRDA